MPKYTKSNYPSNFNELILDKILKDEVNKDILNFILNDLLIKDWLEIFLYKKKFLKILMDIICLMKSKKIK